MYSQQVQAIQSILSTAPELSSVKQVYAGDFEVIAQFPAIAVALRSRAKEPRGIGGLMDTVCYYDIWVYVNKPNYQSALEELEQIVEQVERVLAKNKTLNGTCHHLSFSGQAEFGATNGRGDMLLQTALIQISTRTLGVESR